MGCSRDAGVRHSFQDRLNHVSRSDFESFDVFPFADCLSSPGEPIPSHALTDAKANERAFIGLNLEDQIFLSLVDQAYHSEEYANLLVSPSQYPPPTTRLYYQLGKSHASLGVVDGTHYQTRFTHLTTYAAKYYSYLLSKV